MKLAKIILASSALTLALAGGASAVTVFDPLVNDPDTGTGGSSQNILSAQHSYVQGSSPTNQFFTITLNGAAATNTYYDILINNKAGGSTKDNIDFIDYYFSTKGNAGSGTTTLYNADATAFTTGTYTKSGDGKTLTWGVKSNLGSNFTWYATAVQGQVKDSTGPVSATPIPGAAWLLGSGVIGLVGLKRRSNNA